MKDYLCQSFPNNWPLAGTRYYGCCLAHRIYMLGKLLSVKNLQNGSVGVIVVYPGLDGHAGLLG